VERAEKGMNTKITEDVKCSWSLFTPSEAMRFLPTGVRLAAEANFYIPADMGRQIKLEGES
jgi:hypothetical protein